LIAATLNHSESIRPLKFYTIGMSFLYDFLTYTLPIPTYSIDLTYS
jgi:hypothetical protein